MKLVSPSLKFEESWTAAIAEFEAEGTKGFWNIPEKPKDCESYIQRCEDHAAGKNLPEDWVPATTYWLIDKNKFVGHVNIRHELNYKLKMVGSHIGYAIRLSERKKGYGTEILHLALEKAREMRMKRVMLTCGDDNVGSRKIIEKNGGVLDKVCEYNEGVAGPFQGIVRRYWIDL
jgi:predicted acetyltransferase